MSIELVVFDMAGTTVYDGDAVAQCLIEALRHAGVTVTRDEATEYMGIPKPLAIRALLEQKAEDPATITEATVSDIHADFLVGMLAYYEKSPEVREVEGTSEVFRKLRAAGIKVTLDTGFSRPIANAIVQRLGWERNALLDATVTSDEVERGRPYPDMVFHLMERTGVAEAARVAKVGDTPSDLQQGSAAGCGWVIGVTEGSHTREQLQPFAHTHLIGTVAEFPALLI